MARKVDVAPLAEPDAELVDLTWFVYEQLGTVFGINPWQPRRTPMHELISTILSHRTTEAKEEQAFMQLWERFGSWEAIRDAPVEQIAEAIKPSSWPEQKAPRIKAVLDRIFAERGAADISFLADVSPEEGQAWLESLPGVGPKTATLVLLFCFKKPLLPVDTHVFRVSWRVGILAEQDGPNAAHVLLPRLLPNDAEVLWNFHMNVLHHGQQVCRGAYPRCGVCVLRERCEFAKQRGVA
jgi:endonuclease-3